MILLLVYLFLSFDLRNCERFVRLKSSQCSTRASLIILGSRVAFKVAILHNEILDPPSFEGKISPRESFVSGRDQYRSWRLIPDLGGA